MTERTNHTSTDCRLYHTVHHHVILSIITYCYCTVSNRKDTQARNHTNNIIPYRTGIGRTSNSTSNNKPSSKQIHSFERRNQDRTTKSRSTRRIRSVTAHFLQRRDVWCWDAGMTPAPGGSPFSSMAVAPLADGLPGFDVF